MAYQPRRTLSPSTGRRNRVSPASGGDWFGTPHDRLDSTSTLEGLLQGSPHRSNYTSEGGPCSSDEDGEEGESEEHKRYGQIPLVAGQKMEIDDQNATLVFVFPRQKDQYGKGTVNPNAVRENPKADWEKIFRIGHQHLSKHKLPPNELKRGPVPESTFQKHVRAKFLKLLRDAGLKAVTSESIDEDEVFLKISLDHDGDMIAELAETYQYRMPFKRECYEKEPNVGPYPGGRPMMNSEGVEVLAYQEFNRSLRVAMQPFNKMDEVRLISIHLWSLVNLREMQAQNIICRYFCGADYQTVMKLHSDWADWQNVFLVPTLQNESLIRSYFGEEIAFFFRWLGMYIRMLGIVAGLAICAGIRHLPDLQFTVQGKDVVKIIFGFFVMMWEGYLNKANKAMSARAVQTWGTENFEQNEPALPSYDRNLEGTQGLRVRKAICALAVVAYLAGFMCLIGFVNWKFYSAMLRGQMQYSGWQPYVQSILIKVLSFVWRKIAYYLVLLQNHRTQTRFNNSLIFNLSMVKLFVALWPFFYMAILRSYIERTCADSLSEAAHKIYSHIGWPSGIDAGDIGTPADSEEYIPVAELGFLQGYWHLKPNATCIDGCYPVECIKEKGELLCTTNCLLSLQDSLSTLYIIQVGSSIVFILIPIFLTWWEVTKEIKEAMRLTRDPKKLNYSFIQMQAKLHDTAPYAFQQWGGSYVEDFLDVAVGYALLVCFGICYPMMAVIGFMCMLVQYRLLAYRMTNVTCRPYPRGSEGIGLFADVFETISYFSVFFNVLLSVVVLLPCKNMPVYAQAAIFILGEKLVFILRGVLEYVMPTTPPEVTFIQDFNNEFKKTFNKRTMAERAEKVSYDEIDIGLRPKWDNRGASSSDDEGSPVLRRFQRCRDECC